MAAAVIRAVDPITGETFIRATARTYHAAIVATDPSSGSVEVLAWCGRPDLAWSQLDRAVRGTLDSWRQPRPDARLAIVEPVLGEATAAKPARPRTLAGLSSHPWVESVSDERGMGAGIWVYLRPGFVNDAGGHTIHEATVKGCLAAFADIRESAEDAPAARPVLPGEQTPPPAPSHGDAAPTLPELRADAAAGRPVSLAAVATAQRRLHPMAEMLLMRLAATREPWLAVERLPLWESLAEAGWIELWNRVSDPGQAPWCECRITDAGRAALDARPSV